MARKKKNDIDIVAGLPPEAKKGQLVTMDFEMFDQVDGKLHRPNGSFALISVKLETDPVVYQLYDQKDLRKLVRVVRAGTWAFHNALYDLRQFRRYADIQPRFIWDTMLIEQSLYGGLYQNFGLADLTRRYLNRTMEKETREHFYQKRDIDPQMKQYAAIDVINTEEIALIQDYQSNLDADRFKVYIHADEPMIFPVLDLQGFRVDVEGWEIMVKEFARKGKEIEDEIDVNVYSHAKVKDILRKQYRITIESTKNEILVSLLDDAQGKAKTFIEKVIEARMYRKAASTYGMKWLEEHVEEDGKVYSDYKITGADKTGRMSSAGPNMQNIPQRKLPEYRERFLASPGHLLGVWDVSQQEPSITAYHSQDRRLLEALRAGESLHLSVARAIYENEQLEKSDKMEYSHGKQINLGLTYGLTASGLSRRTGLTIEEAESMILKYFTKFSGVHSYIQSQRRNAFRDGYVTTALGRRSYLNLYDHKWENNAINSPIQGGAADFTKIWAYKTWKNVRSAHLPPTMVAFVHDETVDDTPKEIMRERVPLVEEAFVETAEFLYKNIPFAVDKEFGNAWSAKSIEAERISLDFEEGDE